VNWVSTPLGRLYRVRDQRAGSLATALPLMSVSQYLGVVPRVGLMGNDGRADDLTNYKLCFPGDVVLNRMSAYNGALGVARERGLVSPDYLVMEPTGPATADFLTRWLKTPFGVSEMTQRLRGIGAPDAAQVRTPRINHKDLRGIPVSLPPLSDQHAIADYLDRVTGQIDALIGKQEQLIETLRTRRAAVVDTAVLASAPTRVPLRRVADAIDCAHVTAEFVDNDRRFPVASIRECGGESVDLSNCNYTTAAFFELLRAAGRAPRDGDLLFTRNVSVGRVSAVAPGTVPFAVGQETVLLRRKPAVDPAFLRYALTSGEARHTIEAAMMGSTFRRINVSAIRSLPVRVPTLREQRHIAAHLDEQTAKIDAIIVKAERFIELAKERRVALIAAAVTGQIDVRTTTSVGEDA